MNIELRYPHLGPAVTETRRRTDRVLEELAPYANITLIKTSARSGMQAPGAPRPLSLSFEGQPVPNSTPTQTHLTPPILESSKNQRSSDPGSSGEPIPAEQDIRAHLVQALLNAGPGAIRLPLPHRRIITIGLLLMLTGALTGQFFSGGPALTFTGLALLPVGLSTNGRRTGRQPLMSAAIISVCLSAGFLLWYFGPLITGSAASTPPPSGIFYAGIACLALAWVVAFAALFSRQRMRRELTLRLQHELSSPGTSSTP